MLNAFAREKPKLQWSYSRLHGFELCPRRYYETQVLKAWPEDKTPQLAEGDAVHAAMAAALQGAMLPTKYRTTHQHWIDKVLNTKGELLVEEDAKWAIDRQFKPTTWFSKTVWLRCIADAVKLNLPEQVALVVDWKNGKSANADPVQLTLTGLMLFIQFPELLSIRSDFVWLQEDDFTTQVFYRDEAADQWAEILPRVKRFEQAAVNEEYPPKPGYFCQSYCPVETCEYHGTRQ
jgi:PD-(D/E)XK nuclease superfamily